MRREAKARCKVNKDTFRCEKCRRLTNKIQIDHIEPVADLTGWTGDWTSYINRLFCNPEGLQGLDVDCHSKITRKQNDERKKHKKRKI